MGSREEDDGKNGNDEGHGRLLLSEAQDGEKEVRRTPQMRCAHGPASEDDKESTDSIDNTGSDRREHGVHCAHT